LRNGLRWRVLLLFWASLIVPGAMVAAPAFAFLRGALDHSTRADASVAWMDGATAIELARRLTAGTSSHSLLAGFGCAVLALLVLSPFVSAAMVASARSGEDLSLRSLLAGAGEFYGACCEPPSSVFCRCPPAPPW
jgi:hypothetical protein